MNKEQKIKEITNAFEFKKWDNGKEGHIINEGIDKDFYSFIKDLVFEVNSGNFDLNYEIVNDACNYIGDHEDDFEVIDDFTTEFSSVYTQTRLEYLNCENQYDISEVMKEISSDDIATACAVWYDRKVMEVIDELIAFLNN